jgi:hypothetical protein
MQRIATFTALAAIACGAAVAFGGVFEPGDVALQQVTDPSDSASPLSMGRNSAGVLLGAFIGAAVALLSHTLVATALKLSTEAAFKALTVGFFVKCIGAILPWGALSFLPQVGRIADPTAYLVAFAITVVLVLGGGLFDHLRAVNEGSILNEPGRDSSGDSSRDSNKAATEIESDVSDSRSGSAFSLPRKPVEDAERASSAASASGSPVSPPVHPLGSSDSLESAT